jgi:uncharacterized protein (DUF2252 family)
MAPRKPSQAAQKLLASFLAKRPTVDERYAAGKALRTKVPRLSHASFAPSPKRVDPVDVLLAQAKTRLQVLVPVRHARMLTSPFAFLRGSAAVMSGDLATTPKTGLTVQACGDMHVANFGVYASAERNLVFAINDFDETLRGAWEWDVKRLAASAAVAARFLKGSKGEQRAAAREAVLQYQRRMHEYAEMGALQTWYSTLTADSIVNVMSPELRKRAERLFARARQRTHLQVLERMADLVDDKHRIIESKPLVVRTRTTEDGAPLMDGVADILEAYTASLAPERKLLLSRYRLVDVARKVVGVGSVGTRCWILLLLGTSDQDPLFLQMKEAQPSVLAPYFREHATFTNEGQRVVDGQRLIQGSPDIFLGYGERNGKHFYFRQLRDMKGSAEFIPGESPLANFTEYAGLCGWALALAHAKSGDAAMLAGYLGKSEEFVDAIEQFSMAYADQTDRDYAAMKKAAKTKRIQVAASGY